MTELGLCDIGVTADLRDPLAALEAVRAAGAAPADLTVVVVNATRCEPTAILLTADGGTVLFFSMATELLGGGAGGGRDRDQRPDADRQRLLARPRRLRARARPPLGAAARGARRSQVGEPGVTDGHEVQMRWRDLDGLGHVNHTVVLTYLEEGRDAFLEEHGISRDEYVVGRCSVEFSGEIDPAFEAVTVECAVSRARDARA